MYNVMYFATCFGLNELVNIGTFGDMERAEVKLRDWLGILDANHVESRAVTIQWELPI